MTSKPAEAFHVGEYISEELEARGWNAADLAYAMGYVPDSRDFQVTTLAIELTCAMAEAAPKLAMGMLLDYKFFGEVAKAFDVDDGVFKRLHEAWLAHVKAMN